MSGLWIAPEKSQDDRKKGRDDRKKVRLTASKSLISKRKPPYKQEKTGRKTRRLWTTGRCAARTRRRPRPLRAQARAGNPARVPSRWRSPPARWRSAAGCARLAYGSRGLGALARACACGAGHQGAMDRRGPASHVAAPERPRDRGAGGKSQSGPLRGP